MLYVHIYVTSTLRSLTNTRHPPLHISPSLPSLSGNLEGGIDPGLADALAANHHSPVSTIYSDPPDSASPYQQQPAPLDVLQVGMA